MDYEREDKYALCRATLAIAKADALADGGTHVRTAGGLVPIAELFASFDGVPMARGGWIYRGVLAAAERGYIEEADGNYAAAFPIVAISDRARDTA